MIYDTNVQNNGSGKIDDTMMMRFSVCLVWCVFVNWLVKQFAICLGVVPFLMLNVMDVFSVGGGALCWIVRVWSSK